MEQSNKGGTQKAILGLADLPGFGYAKLSKEVQQSVQQAAERYLSKREELALGILLVDSRRVPSDDDRAILAALYDIGVPIVVVATKIDKLSKNELDRSMETIRDELGLAEGQPLQISSVTGEGTKALWTIIMEACEIRVDELKQKRERDNEQVEEVGGLAMDEDGNMMTFDDGEELAYDQGYDWIHGIEKVSYGGDANDFDPNAYEDDAVGDIDEDEVFAQSPDLTLKELKRAAKIMERDGKG
jgi:GTP-binding protein